jgi:hypothetical protein
MGRSLSALLTVQLEEALPLFHISLSMLFIAACSTAA